MNTLGIDRDLLDPPDGSYPHVEWEYLTADERGYYGLSLLGPRLDQEGLDSRTKEQAVVDMASFARKSSYSKYEFELAVSVVVEKHVKRWKQKQLEEAEKRLKSQQPLMGTISDIERFMYRSNGRTTTMSISTHRWPEPIKAGTLMRGNGPALPGEMVMGIAVEDGRFVRTSNDSSVWEVKVSWG